MRKGLCRNTERGALARAYLAPCRRRIFSRFESNDCYAESEIKLSCRPAWPKPRQKTQILCHICRASVTKQLGCDQNLSARFSAKKGARKSETTLYAKNKSFPRGRRHYFVVVLLANIIGQQNLMNGRDEARPSQARWKSKGVQRSPGGTRFVASASRTRPRRSAALPNLSISLAPRSESNHAHSLSRFRGA